MLVFLRSLYIRLFSKNRFLFKINNLLLHLSLGALGYGNYRNEIESGELFFIKKYLSDKSTSLCFDIGANVGDYSKLLLDNTKANIISFEPIPFLFKKLSVNLSNFSERVVLVNSGVGDKSKMLPIFYNKDNTLLSSFCEKMNRIDYVSFTDSVIVNVISIDAYCRDNNISEIDFIKIDTEGYEKEVFQGAKETFKTIQPKFIQIEFNTHQLFKSNSLLYFAEKLPNYNIYQLIYNGMRKIDAESPYSNIYKYSNFVFIRKDCD